MKQNHIPIIIGIMGGIGAGKSRIAEIFGQLGAEVINADQLAHQALMLDEVKRQIVAMWGDHFLHEREIDRKKLAKKVFGENRQKYLPELEKILHPIVRKNIEKKLSETTKKVAVIDAPLLWEGGLYKKCRYLVFVDTPLEIRQKRVALTRGWPDQEIITREKSQGDLQQKKQACRYVIDNKNSTEYAFRQVEEILKEIA